MTDRTSPLEHWRTQQPDPAHEKFHADAYPLNPPAKKECKPLSEAMFALSWLAKPGSLGYWVTSNWPPDSFGLCHDKPKEKQ